VQPSRIKIAPALSAASRRGKDRRIYYQDINHDFSVTQRAVLRDWIRIAQVSAEIKSDFGVKNRDF
jgi:hypothetical protein